MHIFLKSLYIFMSDISVKALSLGFMFFTAYLLGPEGKGIFALIIIMIQLYYRFIIPGLDSSIIYYYKNSIVGEGRIKWLILFFTVSGSIPLIPIYILGKNVITSYFNINYTLMLLIFISIPCLIFNTLTEGYLIARSEIALYNLFRNIKIFIPLGIIFFFYMIKDFNIFLIMIAYLSGIFLVFSFLFFYIIIFGESINISFKGFCPIFSYGFKSYLGNLIAFFNYRLDIILISLILDKYQVGIYIIAVYLSEIIWYLPGAVARILFPEISGSKKNTITAELVRITLFLTMIFIPLLIGIAHLIPYLIGEPFKRSITCFYILLPGAILFSTAKIISADLLGMGRNLFSSISAFAGFIMNLFMNILLIPHIGINGAAIASTIAYSLSMVLTLLYFLNYSHLNIKDVFIIRKEDLSFFIKRVYALIRN